MGSPGSAAVEPPAWRSFLTSAEHSRVFAAGDLHCLWHAREVTRQGGKSFLQSDLGIFGFRRRRADTCSRVWSPYPGTARARGCRVAWTSWDFIPSASLAHLSSAFPCKDTSARAATVAALGCFREGEPASRRYLHAAEQS